MQWLQSRRGEPARSDRARDWGLTARLTLVLAIGAGVLAAATNSRWDMGDLLVALYFAAVSLMLWAQCARIRLARSAAPFTPIVAGALGTAFALGLLLVAVDVITQGSL